MTDTADPTTLSLDERAASARGFFDVGSLPSDGLPPPPPTAVVPLLTAAPAVPQLPMMAPPVPTQAAATPFAFSPAATFAPAPPPSRHKKQKGGGGRRFVSWLIVLGIIGGGAYAAITYGPEVLERTKGDDPTASEPEAPLAFPAVVPVVVPTRTATFVVEQPADNGSTVRYEVTNDFETGVSRLLVDRATVSDIEVLAVFDVAYVHEADQPNWWSLPRGGFPFVGGPERQRWLRTVDEYFPAAMRPFLTIDGASESVIGTEATRHLVVTVDTAGLAASVPTVVIDPATGLEVPAPPPPPGQFVVPAPVAVSTVAGSPVAGSTVAGSPVAGSPVAGSTVEPVTIEMWVDTNGMIRKLIEPASMGGAVVTVTSLSADAFNPTFPVPEVVTPMAAEQLVDFAL